MHNATTCWTGAERVRNRAPKTDVLALQPYLVSVSTSVWISTIAVTFHRPVLLFVDYGSVWLRGRKILFPFMNRVLQNGFRRPITPQTSVCLDYDLSYGHTLPSLTQIPGYVGFFPVRPDQEEDVLDVKFVKEGFQQIPEVHVCATILVELILSDRETGRVLQCSRGCEAEALI